MRKIHVTQFLSACGDGAVLCGYMNDRKPSPIQAAPAAHAPYGEYRRATDRRPDRDEHENWLQRPQKRGGRHSAIVRTLYSWSGYKSWADKVRKSWDTDK